MTDRHKLAKLGQEALKKRAEQGLNRGHLPLGFRRVIGDDKIPKLEPDPATYPFILPAGQMKTEAKSIRAIRSELSKA